MAHCGRSRWLRKKLKIGTWLYNYISNNIFLGQNYLTTFWKNGTPYWEITGSTRNTGCVVGQHAERITLQHGYCIPLWREIICKDSRNYSISLQMQRNVIFNLLSSSIPVGKFSASQVALRLALLSLSIPTHPPARASIFESLLDYLGLVLKLYLTRLAT